ncbi:MAG: 2-oxoglutarate dehydrogenase complex dihydrolipoyllysine-residue succinyltransferase [Brevundimonas sp.]|uniref:2-oxoglutarate dehydrogenase complex dihydrolipoyllysine-residue succinyltransferase n=1 Tax=Brevundimonas sp. TaxID=1871086 RepID=UPI003918EB9C
MADILTPTLGESVSEASVARWTKAVGDTVAKDEVLVELETDKVSLEVAAPRDGVLSEIAAGEGDTVTPGQVLGRIGDGGAAASPQPAKTEPAKTEPAKSEPAKAEAKDDAKADANADTGAALIDVKTPVMGESVAEGSMGTWSKKAGDAVAKDEVLVEIETDKVAVEVASPADGVLAEITAEAGATVTPGQVIARIAPGASAAPASAAQASSPARTQDADGDRPLSPAVQRIVSENNLDPASIEGSGKDGRILKGDALAAASRPASQSQPAQSPARASAPAAPSAPQSAPRELGPREERVRMTRLRQTVARRLKESQNTAAQLTTFNEVDLSAIMALRASYKDAFEKRHGVKLGFMGFFVRATVAALKEIPAVNAEIDGTDIIFKNHYDIGVAVGTDRGLVVPVLRDADQLSLAGIEKGIGDLGRAARDGTLSLDQLQGGTFTITNGGVYGSLMSTPILNMPQTGILGMHAIKERPVAIDGQVVIRPMMYLALSYDHRLVDGKEAVTFLVRIKEHMEDPARLLLDL